MCKIFQLGIYQIFLVAVSASWMTCPISFNPSPARGVEFDGPCETSILTSALTETVIQAGDRLKVGWSSNNQGGGYVRLALVPITERFVHAAFDRNVLKVTCFGHDEREDMFYEGYCHHPCNARGSCDFQKSINDTNRYDTSIAIPTNLEDGRYVLQWKGISSNSNRPTYSCALLHVIGGSSDKKCSLIPVKKPKCITTTRGMNINEFLEGSNMGSFCFDWNGSNNVDVNMGKLVKNYMCDPRQTCSHALVPNSCRKEMIEPSDPSNPMAAGCPEIDNSTFANWNGGRKAKGMLQANDSPSITIAKLPSSIYPLSRISPIRHRNTSNPRNISVRRSASPFNRRIPKTTTAKTSKHPLLIRSSVKSSIVTGGPSKPIGLSTTGSSLGPTIATSTVISSMTVLPGEPCSTLPSQRYCYEKTQFAQCVSNAWQAQSCPPGTLCKNGRCARPTQASRKKSKPTQGKRHGKLLENIVQKIRGILKKR